MNNATRDFSQKQFQAAAKRHGFQLDIFGDVRMAPTFRGYPKSVGPRLRDQLAYLIQCDEVGLS